MRLSPDELAAIRKALQGENFSRIFLFGSRTDDAARGGDIDLLIHSSESPFDLASRVASRFAREFDARIDICVVDPDSPTQEQAVFLSTLHPEPLDDILGL